ncbi:glycosyltransferase family 4 protein [Draconibacterium orientale]|uniref:glycosyltransferase family 4 protein n=1 Tax=Draconibacterium orientale TaxID=1168034 RepID=UPI002ABE8D76|nr:glycosyltransferase family 4 protein [Draconibacterium orientale]
MKVLWITNSAFPVISNQMTTKVPIKGWTHSAAKALIAAFNDIELAIASIHTVSNLKQIQSDKIIHFLVPQAAKTYAKNKRYDYIWRNIKDEFNPDIVHIHGTEYPYSYAYIRACGSKNVVVSIQGLISVIERYYFGGIKKLDILKSITVRDLLKFDTLFTRHRNLLERSTYEKLLIKDVNHIIGRTSWDKAHVWALNPDANYHFCNETLRPSFYNKKWTIKGCERYSIFISQANYPLKGLQQLVKAMPLVLKYYPQITVYVAGTNYFTNRGIRISGYGKYINRLLKKHKLSNHFIFTGPLSEQEMCRQFLKSNVYINLSAIENSPNSVGEAQMLGVPCIASFVGGTSDMVEHEETGLMYRFEEYEMLAYYIYKIFSDDEFAIRLSENAIKQAVNRHDELINAKALHQIYLKMFS